MPRMRTQRCEWVLCACELRDDLRLPLPLALERSARGFLPGWRVCVDRRRFFSRERVCHVFHGVRKAFHAARPELFSRASPPPPHR